MPFRVLQPAAAPQSVPPQGTGFRLLQPATPAPTPQPATSSKPGILASLLNPLKAGVQNVKTIASNVGQDVKGAVSDNALAFKDALAGKKSAFGAGFQAVGNASKAILSPVTETVKQGVQDTSGQLADIPTFDKFASSRVGDALAKANIPADKYAAWATAHPEAAKNLEALGNIAALSTSIPAGSEAGALAKTGLDSTADLTKPVIEKAGQVVTDVGDQVAAHNAAKLETQAIKDATPSYSKKLIQEPGIKAADGSVIPRVQEGGVLKGRLVNPTPLEADAGKALAKVPDYPATGTALEKYQAVQPEIARQGQALSQSLKSEQILRPPEQIVKVVADAVNNVPKESLLLQKSDPVISNYMRVVKNAVAQNDGTLAGELKVRQAMDAAYENARGKLAFGSDKISALDDVHSAARDALNQDIIGRAQSTDVKASLKSQWDLFRASDVLRTKAEAEAGTSLGRFTQRHPLVTNLLKKAARTGATAAGVGTVIH